MNLKSLFSLSLSVCLLASCALAQDKTPSQLTSVTTAGMSDILIINTGGSTRVITVSNLVRALSLVTTNETRPVMFGGGLLGGEAVGGNYWSINSAGEFAFGNPAGNKLVFTSDGGLALKNNENTTVAALGVDGSISGTLLGASLIDASVPLLKLDISSAQEGQVPTILDGVLNWGDPPASGVDTNGVIHLVNTTTFTNLNTTNLQASVATVTNLVFATNSFAGAVIDMNRGLLQRTNITTDVTITGLANGAAGKVAGVKFVNTSGSNHDLTYSGAGSAAVDGLRTCTVTNNQSVRLIVELDGVETNLTFVPYR